MNESGRTLITITSTAELLGICPQTLRKWEVRDDFPLSVFLTLGGHRRYSREEVEEFISDRGRRVPK